MTVETQLKTGIAESLLEPLMKIAHKLLISDKSTFEQLTPSEQPLWTQFETEDIYLKFCIKPILFFRFYFLCICIIVTPFKNIGK